MYQPVPSDKRYQRFPEFYLEREVPYDRSGNLGPNSLEAQQATVTRPYVVVANAKRCPSEPSTYQAFCLIAQDHAVIDIYIVRRSLVKTWLRKSTSSSSYEVAERFPPLTILNWFILRYRLLRIIKLEFEARKVSQPSKSIDMDFVPSRSNMLNLTYEASSEAVAVNLWKHPKLGTNIGVQEEKEGDLRHYCIR